TQGYSRANMGTWLNGVSGRPFHLYVHTMELHNPYDAPDEILKNFDLELAAARRPMNLAMNNYRRFTRVDFSAGRRLATTDNTAEQEAALAALDGIKPR